VRPDLDAIDPGFKADLAESNRWVWIAARWLQSHGHHVTVRAVRVRPRVQDIAAYSDDGDLEIIQRVEVKHRIRHTFTSAADHPFPEILVDTARVWDDAKPKPYAYVILNIDATVAAIVLGSTAPKWRKETHSIKGRPREVYLCPLRYVKFTRIPETVRS
jgi:Holliday junction resolvase-like predicted endonuclease